MGVDQKKAQINVDNNDIMLTNIEKLLWRQKGISKYDFISYLISVSQYFLPFLENRLLTVIRFPDGVEKESFYQRNCPDYAPLFIKTENKDDIDYILCNDQSTLIWLGNQAAIEFHVPYNLLNEKNPIEIVIDLDPPSQTEFSLAIEAALILKEIFEKFQIQSFIKTSGNKGLQIHIPTIKKKYSYDKIRTFTSFLAEFLVAKEPHWFTTERIKSKRNNRLYVDYLQHAYGKTIVAPYSTRGNEQALVACPLLWNEVNQKISPHKFDIYNVISRTKAGIVPFDGYFDVENEEALDFLLNHLEG